MKPSYSSIGNTDNLSQQSVISHNLKYTNIVLEESEDLDLFCDRDDNCGDNSDEAEAVCHRISPAAAPLPCEAGLACGSLCLPVSARCNGTYECSDLTDEINCSPCSDSTFTSRSDGQCVTDTLLCDGTPDYRDASDEEHCAPVSCSALSLIYISS